MPPSPHSIGFIVCYFGERPPWANAFLASCRHNNTVDFLILSNCFSTESEASNIHIIPCTPKDIESRVEEKLHLQISLEHPMKICDLRPAFGILFSEELEDYEFWGHVDTDIIFGEIRRFITGNLLQTYDILSTRSAYISGPCTLYRNIPEVNQIFLRFGHYKSVFMDPEYQNFDECHFNWYALLNKERTFSGANMTDIVRVAHKEGQINLFMEDLVVEFVDLPPSYWLYWTDGILYNLVTEKEIMCHHFHAAKKSSSFSVDSTLSADSLISKIGIHPVSTSLKRFLNLSKSLTTG